MSASSVENATKTENTTLKTYGKLSLVIFLTLYQHLGLKGAKFVFMKHFYQSFESSRMRALWTTVNVCRVWHHDASNSSNSPPVVEWKANRTITMTPFERLDLPYIIIVDLRICFIHLFCSEFWNVFVFALMISYIRTIQMSKNS